MRPALSVLAILLHRLTRHEPAATIAGFASNSMTAATLPGFGTAITHLREVLGDQTYTLAIRRYHDSGNTTQVRTALAVLAAFFDRLGSYQPAAAIAGFALSPLTAIGRRRSPRGSTSRTS